MKAKQGVTHRRRPKGSLLLDPFGIDFGYKEIINARLDITIKPATCRACDEDIPDSIGRNTIAICFSASHTELTGEEFHPTGIVFRDEGIVDARPGIPIKPPCCGARDEDIPDGIGRYFITGGCGTDHAQLTGEEFQPTGIVFRDECIPGTCEGIAIKRALRIAHDEDIPDSIDRHSCANGCRANCTQLPSELLDPTVIVLGNKEIPLPRQGVIVE